MIVGEKIKELRLARKLSMRELAELMGYANKSAIVRIERGETDLPQSRIAQFARVLGTTTGHLMGWDEEPENAGTIAAKVVKDRELFKMVEEYYELSETDRYAVRLLVSSLHNKKKTDT